MDTRPLGDTGLRVTPIGFGAFKIGRNVGIKYPQGYALPSDDAVERLLNGVLDLGINFIDTAPAYGASEERIGRAIGRRRDEFILSTKVGETFEAGTSSYDFSPPAVRASVDRSRSRLRADVIDIVYIHSDGRDVEIMQSSGAVEALQALRDEGVIRAIGLSGKTVEGARAALEWSDVLMIEYHVNDRSHERVMGEAATQGAGVVVKKGLASGTLPPEEAIRFVLGNAAVSSLVVGGLNLEHIRANCEIASQATRSQR